MSAQWDFTFFKWRGGSEDAIREFSYDDDDWYDDEYECRASHGALPAVPMTDHRRSLELAAPPMLLVFHEETGSAFLILLRTDR